MKKLFALLIAAAAMLICGITSRAQDVILTKDSQIILSIVTEVSESMVTYKSFDNQNGPDYKISTSRIQKIKFANGAEQTFSQAAPKSATQGSQPLFSEGFMDFSHGDFLLNGRQVDETEFHNYFNADEFETINGALRQRKSGKGLLIAGSICAGVGLAGWIGGACICTYADSEYDFYIGMCCAYSGLCLTAAGSTMLAVGTPLFCIGNSRLRWAANHYNSRQGMSLSLATGSTGVGLALKF